LFDTENAMPLAIPAPAPRTLSGVAIVPIAPVSPSTITPSSIAGATPLPVTSPGTTPPPDGTSCLQCASAPPQPHVHIVSIAIAPATGHDRNTSALTHISDLSLHGPASGIGIPPSPA